MSDAFTHYRPYQLAYFRKPNPLVNAVIQISDKQKAAGSMQSTSGQHMCSLSNNIHTNYRVCGSTYGVHMAKRDCGLCSCVVSTYFSESCLSIVRVTKLCPTHHPRVHGYERDPNEYHNNNHNLFRYVIGWVRTQPTDWLL